MSLRIQNANSMRWAAATFALVLVIPPIRLATNGDKPDATERKLVVNLVRVINTAELVYRQHEGNGSYTDWSNLIVSPAFKTILTRFSTDDAKLKDVNPSASEILPGWRLRLTVSEDHQSYTLVLMSTTDDCGYVLTTDEGGTIREGSAIACRGKELTLRYH